MIIPHAAASLEDGDPWKFPINTCRLKYTNSLLFEICMTTTTTTMMMMISSCHEANKGIQIKNHNDELFRKAMYSEVSWAADSLGKPGYFPKGTCPILCRGDTLCSERLVVSYLQAFAHLTKGDDMANLRSSPLTMAFLARMEVQHVTK